MANQDTAHRTPLRLTAIDDLTMKEIKTIIQNISHLNGVPIEDISREDVTNDNLPRTVICPPPPPPPAKRYL